MSYLPLQSSPTEPMVLAAAEGQESTSEAVAKPDHAASGAAPKSSQGPSNSSYTPVTLAPYGPKSGIPSRFKPIGKVSKRGKCYTFLQFPFHVLTNTES